MRYRRAILVAVASVTLTLAACVNTQPQPAPRIEPQESVYGMPAPGPGGPNLVVAPDGHDDAPGTAAAPLRSIDAAANRVKPGDVVLVRNGTYTGDVETTKAGTASARIAFVAESPKVKVVGSADREGVWENNADYVDIVGFDITGPNGIGVYSRGSHVRIMHNRVHDMRGNCIYTQNDDYSLTDIDVIGNVTANCGNSDLDHGIYVTQRRGVVANNISYGSSGFGIQCWHACNEIVIVNNLVFDNREGGIVIGGEYNKSNGEGGAVDKSLVANNIAVDNGRDGLREGGESGPDNRFVNNLLWGNDRDDISLSTGKELGTVVADPKFVNFRSDGSGDYRLEPGSPAVDSGTAERAPSVAIDGTPRPQSGGVDMGPYER